MISYHRYNSFKKLLWILLNLGSDWIKWSYEYKRKKDLMFSVTF